MNEMPNVLLGRSSSLQGGRVHPDLEALLVLQDADVAIASCDVRLKSLEPETQTLGEQLAGRRDTIGAEREGAVLARAEAARGVNASLLVRYDRIRRGKAPLAVFPLHDGTCGNCFTAVPTQRRALIQRGATIEGCEACGVLLYAKEA